MKRQLLEKLMQWKNSPERKPLILEGARQVGKTYLLKEEFGSVAYKNVVYLNLQNPRPEILEVFEETLDPKRIVTRLELLLGEDIAPGETLLILDEIQEVPRALTSLKYFYEEAPEYHVASAGSLLGVFLHHGTSFPVGKVDTLRLEPLNFKEFLWARGEERAIRHLEEHPEDTIFNSTLMDLFREYMVVGGMPEVVRAWVENRDVERVNDIQQRILMSYRGDFSKYVDKTTAVRIRQVFDRLPSQFAKAHEKFMYGVVKGGARARDYEMAIEWLIDAGLVRRVRKVQRGDQLPLMAYEDPGSFKLYFLDVGLFRQLAEIPASVVLEKDAIFDQFNGLMAEQYILQELSGDFRMYYWTSQANAEVDFVTQVGADIIPIEVKSGENVRAQSLKVYREKYHPRLAVRFSLRDLNMDMGILNIPLYESFVAVNLIRRKIEEDSAK